MMIISAIAIPVVNGVLDNYKLNSEARQLAEVLKVARNEAIYYGQTVTIVFYPNDNSYMTRYVNISGKKNTYHKLSNGIRYVGKTTFIPSGIERNPYCAFNSAGTPVTAGTVTLANKKGVKKYIIVNPVAGRVRISDNPPQNWN
ncbi:MAG: hypothetical protein GX333_02915 [Syntrophomonadaceae bacterium]|nr:hypothetical protein [Syntrophomonadaceae bacterium]